MATKASRKDRISSAAIDEAYDLLPHRTATCRSCGEAIHGSTCWFHVGSGVVRCAGIPRIALPA